LKEEGKTIKKCEELYRDAIHLFKESEHVVVFLYIEYAKFQGFFYDDGENARITFEEAIKKFPDKKQLWDEYINLEISLGGNDLEERVRKLYEKATKEEKKKRYLDEEDDNENQELSFEDKTSLTLSYIDFLVDYGLDVQVLRDVSHTYGMQQVDPEVKRKKELYLEKKKKEEIETYQSNYNQYYSQYYNYPPAGTY